MNLKGEQKMCKSPCFEEMMGRQRKLWDIDFSVVAQSKPNEKEWVQTSLQNSGRPYSPKEIYNCRNKNQNGKFILLRESAKKTKDTKWIETVLEIENHVDDNWDKGAITRYRNRFAEWIGPRDNLENTLFTNFSVDTHGEEKGNAKSPGFEKYLKESGAERTVEILNSLCSFSKGNIVIYTTYDIFDKITQATTAEEDKKGFSFNGKRKRHATFEYKGHKFELYEIIHPSRCPKRDS